MQQPHRPGQRDFARTDHHHLAAHPAQIGQRVARRQPAAVDDEVGRQGRSLHVDTEADRHAATLQQVGQRRQSAPRVEMSLARKEQGAAEAAGQVRLELADPWLVAPFEIVGAFGEARQFGGVAWRGDDQAAVARRAGTVAEPPVDRRRTQGDDRLVGRGSLAPRRQHAARHPRAAALTQHPAALDDVDRQPAFAELERGRQTGDARSNHSDLRWTHALLPFLRRHDPDQVLRVQPLWLSQTGATPDTPRTSRAGNCRRPPLSSGEQTSSSSSPLSGEVSASYADGEVRSHRRGAAHDPSAPVRRGHLPI